VSAVDFAGFAGNLLSDIVSNVLCVLLPVLVALLLYQFRARRRLRGFFGLAAGRGSTVQIRLSNIQIKSDGTLSEVKINTSMIGSALLESEYEHSLRLASTIQSRPFVGSLFTLLELFNAPRIDAPVTCRIGSSPGRAQFADATDSDSALLTEVQRIMQGQDCLILAGSQVYNVLTRYALEHAGSDARVAFSEAKKEPGQSASAFLAKEGDSIHTAWRRFDRGPVEERDDREVYVEYFLLQKLCDFPRKGRTVFICAGTSQAATAAALDSLSDWRSLFQMFKNGPFAMVYSVITDDRELARPGSAPSFGKPTREWVHPR
jgi:hypothetical protein